MIQYRIFRNFDTSALTRLWSTCGNSGGLVQPVSEPVFDSFVLGRPYFDRRGLIVAEDEGKVVGFVHAGFGPNAALTELDTATGVVCAVVVRPDRRRQGIGRALLKRAEEYLAERGSKTIYAGGYRPNTPFYTGLYGYTGIPGVLQSLSAANEFFAGCGYRPLHRVLVWERRFKDLAIPFERQQFLIRRSTDLRMSDNPPLKPWWNASLFCLVEMYLFELISKQNKDVMASAYVWRAGVLDNPRGFKAARLSELLVEPNYRRSGFGTFILSEVCRRLQEMGVDRLQSQVSETNQSVLGLYQKLGFECIDSGTLYYRDFQPGGSS